MRMLDVLMKKRNGEELTTAEINFIIEQYTANEVPDYQMSAFLMAVFFKGMTTRERTDLTMAMMHSGDVLDLSGIPGIKVDKHSTGGVGDKTSLPLAAMVAATGIPVPMISGRGLGHTGGTLDKLEAIPGFRVELTEEEFKTQVKNVGTAIVGATGNIAPADKRIYALRDVTATVDSIPLISGSIMSKKLATGSDALVLDVKTGSGAFMKTEADAVALAEALVGIGVEAGVKMQAVISDMNQPLGNAVGNTLEIIETVESLKGNGPADLMELCLVLGSSMVVMGGKATDEATARVMLEQTIADGSALAKFKDMVAAQGGDIKALDDYSLMPGAQFQTDYTAKTAGFVSAMVADAIGIASMRLGGGRAAKDDVLDLGVGIMMHKKIGDAVEVGTPILTIYSNREDVSDIAAYLDENVSVAATATKPTLIHQIING